jgi:hypothetical protein
MGNDIAAIDAFIARWQGREGGQERANYSMFLTELCRTLGLPVPDPAGATTEDNDYVFERMVKDFLPDGSAASRRIDLSMPTSPARERIMRNFPTANRFVFIWKTAPLRGIRCSISLPVSCRRRRCEAAMPSYALSIAIFSIKSLT